jgi:hypothetical protein
MRTTLDIDEDVLMAAREISRRRGVAMGQVVSDLARQALSSGASGGTRNGLPVIPVQPGAGVVTPELVRRLLDESP